MSVKCIPLEPHFYIVKLGYAGVYLFFLFLLQNIDCGYSLEPPQRGGSNVYPQSMFWAKIRKISKKNSAEKFKFLKLKNLCLLHGQVFVMSWTQCYLSVRNVTKMRIQLNTQILNSQLVYSTQIKAVKE